MTFANEVRDFMSAFGAMTEIFGTPESREGERLDNEYRRARIDYTRAETARLGGADRDIDAFLAPGYHPSGFDYDADTDGGGGGGPVANAETNWSRTVGDKGSGWAGAVGGGKSSLGALAGSGVRSTALSSTAMPTPRIRPTAALDDADLEGDVEAVSGTNIADAGVTLGGSMSMPQVAIRDRTSVQGLRPEIRRVLGAMNERAKQMGVTLVMTAGQGEGHLSHGAGFDADVIGYVEGNRKWSKSQRAAILAAGGSVGANRFGLYDGLSAHVGIAGAGRPSAMWGFGNRVRGGDSRAFTDPADRAFYQAFAQGKLYGSGEALSRDYFASLPGNGGDPLFRARNAIASIESMGSGGYSAVNKTSGALGRYQVMPQYLGEWSKGALGRSLTPQEFLASPEAQDAVFDYHFGSLFQKYGNLQDAASAWFTGQPLDAGANKGDGNITGAQYVAKFNRALNLPEVTGGTSAAYMTGTDERGAVDVDPGPYPFSQSQEGQPGSSTTNTMMGTGGAGEEGGAGVPFTEPRKHVVVPGDTLWELSKKYNLDTWMQIAELNSDIIKNPDLIYPGQVLKLPGGAEEVIDVPNPPARPEASGVPNPRIRPTPGYIEDVAGVGGGGPPAVPGYIEDVAGVGGGGPPEGGYFPDVAGVGGSGPPEGSYFPDTAGVGGGGPPEGGYFPDTAGVGGGGPDRRGYIEDVAGVGAGLSPRAELQRAIDRRAQIAADTTQPPATKDALLRALDVKIQQLSYEAGSTGSSTPLENVRPVEQRPGLDARARAIPRVERATIDESIRDYREKARGTGPGLTPAIPVDPGYLEPGDTEEAIDYSDMSAVTDVPVPPTRPERGAGMPTPPTRPERGPTDVVSGGVGGAVDAGSRGDDELAQSPAQASINQITNQWRISPDGHVVMPDGRKSTHDTYEGGRLAARAGGNWLARMFFPGNEAVDAGDDGTDDVNAQRYVSGANGFSKSQMQKVYAVVDRWAADNGIELSENDRVVHALGLMGEFYLAQGDSTKYEAMAGAQLQYLRKMQGQWAAIAQAALENGDTSKAVEAAIKSYAQIPDGREVDITGNDAEGWKVTYKNGETGKVISRKVLSPEQLYSMIMGMAPDDVDKFLVKASGGDTMPDMSPQLERMLADVDDTPDGVRPTFDTRGAMELTPAQYQIYTTAIAERGKEADEYNQRMNSPEAKAARDQARVDAMVNGGTPPAAGAATGGGGGGVGDVGVLSGALSGREPPPAATGAPAATATPSGTPAATAVPTGPVVMDHDFPAGTPVEPDSKVYEPGPDQTFGVGTAEDVAAQVSAIMSTETPQAGTAMGLIFKDKEDRRVAEVKRRQYDYQMWYARGGGGAVPGEEVEPTTGHEPRDDGVSGTWKPEKSLYDVPGTITPQTTGALDLSDTPHGQIAARLIPNIPARLSAASRPEVPDTVIAALAGNDTAMAVYERRLQPVQRAWDELKEQTDKEYTAAVERPKPKDFTSDDLTSLDEGVSAILGAAGAPGGETAWTSIVGTTGVDHLRMHENAIRTSAQVIGEINHLDGAVAASIIANMMSANPKEPTMPNYVAVADPIDPNMYKVQPLGRDGAPDSVPIFMPKEVFETIDALWVQRSEAAVLEKQETYPDPNTWMGAQVQAPRAPPVENAPPGEFGLTSEELKRDRLDRGVTAPTDEGGRGRGTPVVPPPRSVPVPEEPEVRRLRPTYPPNPLGVQKRGQAPRYIP